MCTADIGNTHADAVAVADLDPGRPGLEAVLTGANGLKAVQRGAELRHDLERARRARSATRSSMALARLDPSSATPDAW